MGFLDGNRRGRIYDDLTDLNTWASAQATSQAGKDTAYAAVYVDLGSEVYAEGEFVVNVTTITKPVAANNFDIVLQGSKNSSFTTYVPLAFIQVGDTASTGATSTLAISTAVQDIFIAEDQGVGRYIRPFNNDYGGTLYRYIRCYLYVGATPSTGVAYKAYMTRDV